MTLQAHQSKINQCCFYGTNLFFTTSNDGLLKVWNVNTQRQEGEFVCGSPCVALAASAKNICVADSIGQIFLLALQTV
jgi:WD40 repeat protein